MRKLGLLAVALGVFIVVALISKKTPDPQLPPPNQPWVEIPRPEPNKPEKPATYEEALAAISESELKQHIEHLCSPELEGRMSGKKGNIQAAEYIKKIYESYGLQATYHKFSISRMNPGPNKENGDDFTQNVYAWMDGNDPKLKDEVVVVGAHMDHIGYGPSMSQWGGGKIHPGADDNASGTVALLQIAKACSKLKGQNKRTIVFMSFSGEEMGLIGSKYYCNNPIFPKSGPSMSKHVFMVNMDMVGRLGKARTYGEEETDTSADISAIINNLGKKYSFARTITGRSGGGSDHASFYNKRVPVACLHTGMHGQYHTPSDTTDRINFAGIQSVACYAFELSWAVAQSDARPSYVEGIKMESHQDHGITSFKEKE